MHRPCAVGKTGPVTDECGDFVALGHQEIDEGGPHHPGPARHRDLHVLAAGDGSWRITSQNEVRYPHIDPTVAMTAIAITY